LNKKQVAGLIFTIGMGIAGFSALMAMGDNIFGYAFAQTVIKHEILPGEFTF
jgi:hypothetical protein